MQRLYIYKTERRHYGWRCIAGCGVLRSSLGDKVKYIILVVLLMMVSNAAASVEFAYWPNPFQMDLGPLGQFSIPQTYDGGYYLQQGSAWGFSTLTIEEVSGAALAFLQISYEGSIHTGAFLIDRDDLTYTYSVNLPLGYESYQTGFFATSDLHLIGLAGRSYGGAVPAPEPSTIGLLLLAGLAKRKR